MKILVTGANGFVGRALCTAALQADFQVLAALRSAHQLTDGVSSCLIGDISPLTDWQTALAGCDVVVHLAARVHVMADTALDPLAEFRRINVDATLNLAQQAAKAGVKRFVFISSIKVNGEATKPGQPFTADDMPAPIDAYGISKHEAETALRLLAETSGMAVAIIRPPLVYGPGVKANFLSMMRGLHRGLPLPLGSINNKRSLVALDNLVALIITCIQHPAAANQTFLVSDGEDLSTSELLRRMAMALGKTAKLLPCPPWLLLSAAKILGKSAVAQRLCGSLQVDITKTCTLLDWHPPLSVDEGLRLTALAYLNKQ
ncbi:MAG: SDR family oxidoreductase [Methylococcales bacterium]|nr:SDR family oxidoreductase [Methylococcales bacterium]